MGARGRRYRQGLRHGHVTDRIPGNRFRAYTLVILQELASQWRRKRAQCILRSTDLSEKATGVSPLVWRPYAQRLQRTLYMKGSRT